MTDVPELARKILGVPKNVKIWGNIWDCNDDVCGCSQAQIQVRHPNPNAIGWILPENIWTGEFHTDHEPGWAAELRDIRLRLEAERPAAARRVQWTEDAY